MGSEYRIKYEPDADALYIWVREGRVTDSDKVSDGVIVDYDEGGKVLGIEILEFSKRKIDLNEIVIRGLQSSGGSLTIIIRTTLALQLPYGVHHR